jgi:hypothetical protein
MCRMLNAPIARYGFNEGALCIKGAVAPFFLPNFLTSRDAGNDLHSETINCGGCAGEDLRYDLGQSAMGHFPLLFGRAVRGNYSPIYAQQLHAELLQFDIGCCWQCVRDCRHRERWQRGRGRYE